MSLSRLYSGIINTCDKFVPDRLRPLWMHPAGPKTVFFWAPLFKWGLVIAGLNDVIHRRVEVINCRQTATIALTGIIWSRYSLVIIPKNYNLFCVNLFMAVLQGATCARGLLYQWEHKKKMADSKE